MDYHMEMHVYSRAEIDAMVARCGARIVSIRTDEWYRSDKPVVAPVGAWIGWLCDWYYAQP